MRLSGPACDFGLTCRWAAAEIRGFPMPASAISSMTGCGEGNSRKAPTGLVVFDSSAVFLNDRPIERAAVFQCFCHFIPPPSYPCRLRRLRTRSTLCAIGFDCARAVLLEMVHWCRSSPVIVGQRKKAGEDNFDFVADDVHRGPFCNSVVSIKEQSVILLSITQSQDRLRHCSLLVEPSIFGLPYW